MLVANCQLARAAGPEASHSNVQVPIGSTYLATLTLIIANAAQMSKRASGATRMHQSLCLVGLGPFGELFERIWQYWTQS